MSWIKGTIRCSKCHHFFPRQVASTFADKFICSNCSRKATASHRSVEPVSGSMVVRTVIGRFGGLNYQPSFDDVLALSKNGPGGQLPNEDGPSVPISEERPGCGTSD